MSNGVVFKLQPSDPEIPGLIDRYQAELDKDCLAAGERIRKGDCSKENLRYRLLKVVPAPGQARPGRRQTVRNQPNATLIGTANERELTNLTLSDGE